VTSACLADDLVPEAAGKALAAAIRAAGGTYRTHLPQSPFGTQAKMTASGWGFRLLLLYMAVDDTTKAIVEAARLPNDPDKEA
jgi:hypothetical protein